MSNSPSLPAADLEQALSAMTFEIEPGHFALCGFDGPLEPGDLRYLGDAPGQLTCEGGESTLLVHMRHLPALRTSHPGLRVESDLFWVRFRAAMNWEVVGFLAKVTSELAAVGVPLGAVCGFSRDHLFIHERHRTTTLAVLQQLFPATAAQ
jgi:hypothetical protein